jgi:hypothetical protein
MKRETQFNYGFLLVGLGTPLIIDHFLGRKWAVVAAIIITIAGSLLLLAAHQGREEASIERKSRLRVATLFVFIGVALGVGSVAIRAVIVGPCITATATSELLSRIYARGMTPQGVAASYEPTLQELFYQWRVTIVVNDDVQNTTVEIHEESDKDGARLRVIPENASISEPKPKWMSGFQEKNRPPDYYARKIQFPNLTKGSQATVTFRWPLKFKRGNNTLVPSDFSNYDFDIIPDNSCEVKKAAYDSGKQFTLLMSQFQAFSKFSGRKDHKPLKVILDPDEPLPPLGRNQTETTIEAECQDAACDTFNMHQMEARINRNPTVSRK